MALFRPPLPASSAAISSSLAFKPHGRRGVANPFSRASAITKRVALLRSALKFVAGPTPSAYVDPAPVAVKTNQATAETASIAESKTPVKAASIEAAAETSF